MLIKNCSLDIKQDFSFDREMRVVGCTNVSGCSKVCNPKVDLKAESCTTKSLLMQACLFRLGNQMKSLLWIAILIILIFSSTNLVDNPSIDWSFRGRWG